MAAHVDAPALHSLRVFVTLCVLCLLVQALEARFHYKRAKLLERDRCEDYTFVSLDLIPLEVLHSKEPGGIIIIPPGVRGSVGNGSKSRAKWAANELLTCTDQPYQISSLSTPKHTSTRCMK